MIRSISEIGNLWPRCKSCGHIAQCHDVDGCCEYGVGQCESCGTWKENIQCNCKVYVGMTRAEWFALLTPEEISFYHYKSYEELDLLKPSKFPSYEEFVNCWTIEGAR